jgi:hypothetical protein
VALALRLQPAPTRLVIPRPDGPPLLQSLPAPSALAQAGGVLDQSAWLLAALDAIAGEHATIDRLEREA